MPFWGYQLHLASGEVERHITSKEQIKQFLNSTYLARTPDEKVGFSLEKGPQYDVMPKLERTPLMEEDMLEFYAAEFARNGMRGNGMVFHSTPLHSVNARCEVACC